MIAKKINRFLFPLIVLLIDQILKIYLTQAYNYGENIGLRLNHLGQLLGGILTVALSSLLTVQSNNRLAIIGWGLILGGAASNLFDRMVYGSVRDYLNFGSILGWINLADLALTCGVISVITSIFRSRKLN